MLLSRNLGLNADLNLAFRAAVANFFLISSGVEVLASAGSLTADLLSLSPADLGKSSVSVAWVEFFWGVGPCGLEFSDSPFGVSAAASGFSVALTDAGLSEASASLLPEALAASGLVAKI